MEPRSPGASSERGIADKLIFIFKNQFIPSPSDCQPTGTEPYAPERGDICAFFGFPTFTLRKMDDLGPLLVVLFVTALAVVAFLSLQPVPETGVVVVIDAGHGGYDTGAVVAGVQEKDINLALALLVQEKAKGTGLRVILTRDADFYVGFSGAGFGWPRPRGAALYVSIHANYHRDPKVCGVETWVDTNANAESVRLAEALQRAVVLATGAADRGVHRQTLYLRHTSLPTALVEVGYLSCPAERAKLLDPNYQERIAEGILRGILTYLGR
jgi:N-acetylmuramoyl-L-alanine amidase